VGIIRKDAWVVCPKNRQTSRIKQIEVLAIDQAGTIVVKPLPGSPLGPTVHRVDHGEGDDAPPRSGGKRRRLSPNSASRGELPRGAAAPSEPERRARITAGRPLMELLGRKTDEGAENPSVLSMAPGQRMDFQPVGRDAAARVVARHRLAAEKGRNVVPRVILASTHLPAAIEDKAQQGQG
jgi:hypothetical protein